MLCALSPYIWNPSDLQLKKKSSITALQRRFPKFATRHRGDGGASGYLKILFLSFNLCVLFFQETTKFLGQIVANLFERKYLRNGSVRFSNLMFWVPCISVQFNKMTNWCSF
jgi:hypothetical protein